MLRENAGDATAEYLAMIVAVSAHGDYCYGDVVVDGVVDHRAVAGFEDMERESDLGESDGVGKGEEVDLHGV